MNSTDNNLIGAKKHYGIDEPTAEYAIESISHFTGKEKADSLWRSACRKAGVKDNVGDKAQLQKVFQQLSHEDGAVGVLGRSLSIRTSSYRTMVKRGQGEDA